MAVSNRSAKVFFFFAGGAEEGGGVPSASLGVGDGEHVRELLGGEGVYDGGEGVHDGGECVVKLGGVSCVEEGSSWLQLQHKGVA